MPAGATPAGATPAGTDAAPWFGAAARRDTVTPPSAGARDTARPGPGAQPSGSSGTAAWFGVPAGPGDDCDASVVPIVTGHIDPAVLDQFAADLPASVPVASTPAATGLRSQTTGTPGGQLRMQRAARQMIIRHAAQVLSGPSGLAAALRRDLGQPLAASVSLPLDIGAATDTIPVHLRRALGIRDPFCRFPGCDEPAAACQPHHVIPRARGGPTSLVNLVNLCGFHHLTAIHRWGWALTLLADGTTTAISPDGTRTLRSHDPPALTA
jgi:hypothetical protein